MEFSIQSTLAGCCTPLPDLRFTYLGVSRGDGRACNQGLVPCYGRIPKRPYPGESGGKYGIGECQDHGPPLPPLPDLRRDLLPAQAAVRAGRRGRYLAETWGRCAAPSRPFVTALCYGRIRARAAGGKVLVNARIMARRYRPYRIGDAICPSRKLVYGRDGAGDTWPKRGAVVPRRLALLLRPYSGESGGKQPVGECPDHGPPLPPLPDWRRDLPPAQAAVRAGRRG
jgi:hypothetical protein